MNTAQIVMREMQIDSGNQVLQLLAEGVGQPGKPSHAHTHREVLPFDVTGRDVFRVGPSVTHFGYNLRDSWWGVPRRAIMLTKVAKQLDELGEVALSREHVLNSASVEVKPVCRKLKAFICE